jgi:hypothetical protein
MQKLPLREELAKQAFGGSFQSLKKSSVDMAIVTVVGRIGDIIGKGNGTTLSLP